MQGLRQVGGGLVLALFSIVIVLGGISLALAEGYAPPLPPTPTDTLPAPAVAPTNTPNTETPAPTPTATATATLVSSVNCPPPPGWMVIIVQQGDTLETLAARHHTTVQALMSGNCMAVSNMILPGYFISVPILPTFTTAACGIVPYGWIQYIVQSGDNLYQISLRYGVTVAQLDSANCLRGVTTIFAGQKLWVPNVPIVPTSTPIIMEFPTETPPIPTSTTAPPPTSTETPGATAEPSATPEPSASPAPTEPPAPTNTPAPTDTPTPPTP